MANVVPVKVRTWAVVLTKKSFEYRSCFNKKLLFKQTNTFHPKNLNVSSNSSDNHIMQNIDLQYSQSVSQISGLSLKKMLYVWLLHAKTTFYCHDVQF